MTLYRGPAGYRFDGLGPIMKLISLGGYMGSLHGAPKTLLIQGLKFVRRGVATYWYFTHVISTIQRCQARIPLVYIVVAVRQGFTIIPYTLVRDMPCAPSGIPPHYQQQYSYLGGISVERPLTKGCTHQWTLTTRSC